MNTVIETTWSYIASRSWQTHGITYAVLACAMTFFSKGHFWLEMLSSASIGMACFSFGAAFHEHATCTCTCPEESEANS